MNKERFLEDLRAQLSCLDKEDVREIIEEYRLLIDEKVALGQTEKEIIREFGTLEDIAKEYIVELEGEDIYNDLQLKKEKRKSEEKRLEDERKRLDELRLLQAENNQQQTHTEKESIDTKKLVLFILLQVFHIFVLIPFFIGLIGTLFGIGFSGVALIFAAATSALLPLAMGLKIVVGLMIVSIGLLLLNAVIALSLLIYKITKRYVLWNIRLIQ